MKRPSTFWRTGGLFLVCAVVFTALGWFLSLLYFGGQGDELAPIASGPSVPDAQARSLRDLAAQEQMAFWTEIIGYTAIVGLVFSVVGVVVIWQTLIATRQIGENQTRAYVHVEAISIKTSDPTTVLERARAIVTLVNSGATPATSVAFHSRVSIRESADKVLHIKTVFQTRTLVLPVAQIIGPSENKLVLHIPQQVGFTLEDHIPDRGSVITLHIEGHIQYEDVFGQVFKTEFAFYALGISDNFDGEMSRAIDRRAMFTQQH